jgi:transposase
MVADEVDYVIGVDTHRDEHVLAVVTAPARAVVAGQAVAAAPAVLDEPGVGPIVAAQLIVAWSHPGRLSSEACFARVAGVAPVPASSGETQRHRLSRGGDRQLNRALHTIALHRRQHDPATRDYIPRRVAEGKSRRDATRLLKRYLARHLYRLLEPQPLTT